MKCKKEIKLYRDIVKRAIDIICSFLAIIVLSPLFIVVYVLVWLKLGSPVLFKQPRPGIFDKNGKEKIFVMYKFRTMLDKEDDKGNQLPDRERLTSFGKLLRETSLDELPELFNILNGSMSIVGPRPQLVKDMVFMDENQRRRHSVTPGLTGLAQVNGRNAISWEEKLKWDQKYLENITFFGDLKIILKTIYVAIIKRDGVTDDNNVSSSDFGDYLLNIGKVEKDMYEMKQREAADILEQWEKENGI